MARFKIILDNGCSAHRIGRRAEYVEPFTTSTSSSETETSSESSSDVEERFTFDFTLEASFLSGGVKRVKALAYEAGVMLDVILTESGKYWVMAEGSQEAVERFEKNIRELADMLDRQV